MPFTLDNVVPWGRSFDEYRRMFALTEADLELPILGCGDGPASFNAESTALGQKVTSCDPVYAFTTAEIRKRIAATADTITAETAKNRDAFIWEEFQTLEALRAARMRAMETFLSDYERGKADGRYIEAALPTLPFADKEFNLAVCSHFLFLYSDQFSADFHAASVRELCRVAGEVRIFPVLALGGSQSPHLKPVTRTLADEGYEVTIETVGYEFQRRGNKMLRVRR